MFVVLLPYRRNEKHLSKYKGSVYSLYKLQKLWFELGTLFGIKTFYTYLNVKSKFSHLYSKINSTAIIVRTAMLGSPELRRNMPCSHFEANVKFALHTELIRNYVFTGLVERRKRLGKIICNSAVEQIKLCWRQIAWAPQLKITSLLLRALKFTGNRHTNTKYMTLQSVLVVHKVNFTPLGLFSCSFICTQQLHALMWMT